MPAGEVYIPPAGFEGVNGKVVVDGKHENRKWRDIAAKPGHFAHQGRKSGTDGRKGCAPYWNKLSKNLKNWQNIGNGCATSAS